MRCSTFYSAGTVLSSFHLGGYPRNPRIYSSALQTVFFVLVSLLVCLILPTGQRLLSAIGIAGMDRLIQHNAGGVRRAGAAVM